MKNFALLSLFIVVAAVVIAIAVALWQYKFAFYPFTAVAFVALVFWGLSGREYEGYL